MKSGNFFLGWFGGAMATTATDHWHGWFGFFMACAILAATIAFIKWCPE